MSLDGMEAVCVKQECDSDGCGDNEAALYEDHLVKLELVLGPELLQKPSVVYTPPASVTTPLKAACVKPEQEWDSDDGHSETEDHELNEELVIEDPKHGPIVLKEELELGPMVLQPPDSVYTLRASLKTEDKDTHEQRLLNGRCSVVLERLFLNPESRTYTTGLQTYSFRLCEQIQNIQIQTKVNPRENEIKQDRTNKKQSTKANERQVGVIRNKGKPGKHNGCLNNVIAKFQEPSTSTQEDLPSKAQVQEISPDELVVNSSSGETNILNEGTHFKCDMCGKDFSVKSDLEKHVRTHMVSQYSVAHKATEHFTCKTCGGKFVTKLLLQQHAKSRHGVKYFTCGESLQNTEDKNTHAQTSLSGTCSVVLEHVIVALESRICTINPQTYSFRLCDQKQDIMAQTEINPRKNKITKKTKSAKTRKPKGSVEEKKAKPSRKNSKHNSAEMIQEATPEKPAVSSSSSEVNSLTAETNFKCEKCGRGFNIKSDLENHINTHMLMTASTSHKTSEFTCKTCNCTFDTKLLLHEHEKRRHGVKYFACEDCEYATKYAQNLQCHSRTHNGEKRFKFNQCSFTLKFSQSSHLQRHLKTHTGEKPYKCRQCKSAFTTSSNVQRHLRTHTGEKPYKCCQCKSAFTASSDLQRHLRTHTGEKPYKCRQCKSAFTTSSDLQRHLRTHTGEKPYKCRQWKSAFTTSSDLQRHLRTHTGEKPYKCRQCKSAFTTSSHLKSHLMTHTGEKPFKCNQCSFTFTQSSNLQRHLRTHTGEKPFGCNICDYKATQSGNLKVHLMSRH